MTVTRTGSVLIGTALALVLAGCLNGTGDGSGGGNGLASAPHRAAGGAAVERDVEAPEVFQRAERALWDGRPSLGGVWVAHPDVRDPERVIIRNPETGREVVGALFRRERQNPGPAFQVSSDAAAALGMLAGNPAEIRVTAMRTEQVADPAPAAAATADVDQDTTTEVAAAPAPTQPSADTDVDGDIEIAAAATPEPPQERRRLWPFGRRSSADTGDQIAAAPLGDAVSEPAPSPPVAAASAPPPAPTPTPAPSASSSIDRGFIQLGIFSVEENANRALRMARDAGLEGRIIAGQGSGNRFWRVTVGPASSVAERDRNLARVRQLGFTDAYAVAR